jgi:hypothetical protein
VLLVTSYLFGPTRAVLTTAIAVAVILRFWAVGPLMWRDS